MKFVECEMRRTRTRRESGSTRAMVLLGAVGVLVIVLALLRGSATRTATTGSGDAGALAGAEGGSGGSGGSADRPKPRLKSQSGGGGGVSGPAAVVADKVMQFSQGRRQVVEALAQKFNIAVPPDVDRFFAAVEAGEWADIKSIYSTVSAMVASPDAPAGLASIWPALRETYAVAEAKEVWPADQLLSYGQTVLASLKPGMAYVGGSHWGRSIPSLLNETSGEGRGVVLDHAMLSEPGYVDYLGVMYADRMTPLTREDSQKAKEGYLAELADRASNNQLRQGESTPNGEARSFSPGSVAATDVAEKMLLALLEKNPGMSVAIEKPTPGSPLYQMATPLGPIFEVRAPVAGEPAGTTTAAQAEQSVNYWREEAARLQSAPQTEETVVTRRSMADMAISQANLLASRSLPGEAEQTFRSAIEIAPMVFEPAGELAKYLNDQGRPADAQQVLDDYLRRNPGREGEVEYLRSRLKAPKG